MKDLASAPALAAAVELLRSCERRTAAFPDKSLAGELRANCVNLIAQSVYVALLDDVPARRAALDEMRRAAKRLSILIDVAQARRELDAVAASRLRVHLGAALHAARPRKPQAQVQMQVQVQAPADDDVTIPEVRRGGTRRL